MKRYFLHLGVIAVIAVFAACSNTQSQKPKAAEGPVDPDATEETKALFTNLKQLAQDHVLFGHQDDLAYGVKWVNEPGRSDVKSVAGSYPAVYGWEVGDIGNEGATANLDDVNFDDMRGWMQEGYERGGINTISWHMDNPVTDGGSWDTTRVGATILPGGEHHQKFLDKLDRFAAFVKTLKGEDGEMIPIIFRPFHEHTGSWFWWGAGNITAENYKKMYRFTQEYLREEHGLHNLLYAYSPSGPDNHGDRGAYYNFYPGDEYVDIIGFDSYFRFETPVSQEAIDQKVASLTEHMAWVVDEAEKRGKIPAFTETGFEGIPYDTFWTDVLLRAFKENPGAQGIAYVVMWRNANENQIKGHYYVPYPGHPSADNFKKFTEDPLILLEDELPALYTLN